jgi:hypothetical protein
MFNGRQCFRWFAAASTSSLSQVKEIVRFSQTGTIQSGATRYVALTVRHFAASRPQFIHCHVALLARRSKSETRAPLFA